MKVYNSNGEEEWEDEMDIVIEKIIEDFPEMENKKLIEIYEGETELVNHESIICKSHIDLIIERANEDACCDYGECAELYLDDMNSEKCESLRKLIVDFLNKNAKQPRWQSVGNIKKILVPNPFLTP